MTPLRERMLEDMQIRNLSPHTQRAYVENVARFARHFGRSPADLGPEEIRTYHVYLIRERHLAPSSLEIVVCALRFLYKVTLQKPWSFDELIPAPKKPRRLPVVLSPDEVVRALDCVTSPKHRAVLTACYAAGLRISEAVRLRPRDLDSQRMVIRIEQGKGQRDRYVMLSPKLLAVLRDWWRLSRPTTWLFPGDQPDHPLGRAAVEQACHRARRRARLTVGSDHAAGVLTLARGSSDAGGGGRLPPLRRYLSCRRRSLALDRSPAGDDRNRDVPDIGASGTTRVLWEVIVNGECEPTAGSIPAPINVSDSPLKCWSSPQSRDRSWQSRTACWRPTFPHRRHLLDYVPARADRTLTGLRMRSNRRATRRPAPCDTCGRRRTSGIFFTGVAVLWLMWMRVRSRRVDIS